MEIGNKKALSPVVAAIILIVITIAVSITVAVWMNSRVEVEEEIFPKQSTIKTYYLGNEIYKSDHNCYYFHGTYNNYLVIGHETTDLYKRGMSNMYVQINVEDIIHIHNVSFKILEIGTDYVIMERK